MAITGGGFAGGMPERTWAAEVAPMLGSTSAFHAPGDFAASVTNPTSYTIGPGICTAWGVSLNSSSPVTITGVTPAASGTRYDYLVAHRKWNGTNAGVREFVHLTGTATIGRPAGMTLDPGTEAHQYVALVTVGTQGIVSVTPFRTYGGASYYVTHQQAIADTVRVGDMTFDDDGVLMGRTATSGTPGWKRIGPRSGASRLSAQASTILRGRSFTFGQIAIASTAYARTLDVRALVNATLSALVNSNQWSVILGVDASKPTINNPPAITLAYADLPLAGSQSMNVAQALSASYDLPANQAAWISIFANAGGCSLMQRSMGGSMLDITWRETY